MKIPLVDLKAHYLSIKTEIDEAIQRVIDNTAFIMGEEVKGFEEEFARYCNVKYAIGTSSGTTALHLALITCGVGAGDEVITVPNTFIATAEVISQCGAKVVFVDIDEKSYNLDPETLEAAITQKTKAILPVHLYGQPANLTPIIDIAKEHNLKVIEDAAQAHGAEYNGQKVGGIGDVGCFSFYPAKNLGAFGDAGMLVTNNDEIAKKVDMLRNHGRFTKYEHLVEGYNYRLDALQAAILGAKLRHLDKWTDKRRYNANLYNELLQDANVITPKEMDYAKHVYHLYVIRATKRDELQNWLESNGISTGIHYPIPLHLQKAYEYLGHQVGDFPAAEKCANEILSLPMYPELKEEQIERIVKAIKRYIEEQKGK